MRFTILFLALALLFCEASAVKLNASTQIDWSEWAGGPINITFDATNVGGKLSGVTNGTADQDAVTYSQLRDIPQPYSYIVTHDSSTIRAYSANGSMISSATYPSGIQTVLNVIYADFDRLDIGGSVLIRAGAYYPGDVVASPIPAFVTVYGENLPFQSNWGEVPEKNGTEVTRFLITNTTESPFSLTTSGASIERLAFLYPDQNNNSAPIPYAPTIVVGSNITGSKNNQIRYVNFGNAYWAINASAAHECMTVQDCTGYPLYLGMRIDTCSDVDRISNNHFNPNSLDGFGYAGATLLAWVKANGTVYEIGRADNSIFTHNFAYGYNTGVRFLGTDTISRMTFANNDFDAMGGRGFEYIADSGAMVSCIFRDNIILSQGDAIVFTRANYYNTFSGNAITCGQYAIWVSSGTGNAFIGNVVFDYGSEAVSDTVRAFTVSGNGNTIIGNTMYTSNATYTQAIYLYGSGSVVGNTMSGSNLNTVVLDGSGMQNVTANSVW